MGHPARAGGDAEQVRCLAEAVALYRGELLPGCFEEWVLQERQWLAERYFQALSELIAHLERGGEWERAVELARRGVRADPLREEAHHDLIRLLAATGQRETALRQYEELERRLAQDLGDEPSAEVHALAATLRMQLSEPVSPAVPEPAPQPVSPVPGSNLPLPLDRFFGRRSELARLIALLRPLTAGTAGDEEPFGESAPPRLITLTGPGGSGKTRLALEVARRLQPGSRAPIWFVPLQGLTPAVSPASDGAPTRPPILEEVRDALRLPRTPGADPLEQVVTALREQPALLILDNFEHLVEGGAPLVQVLLQRAPTLMLLVASRRRLNLPGEQELAVLPLPVPAMGEVEEARASLTTNPSFQLFADRAQAARSGFQLTPSSAGEVARLCARLEGIPLAIELAAGRAGALTPAQILERLTQPFELLVSRQRGVEARHRSLRAALEWSYQLLPLELRQFFSRLSIFRGGWTLAAAEAVCEAGVALENMEELRECSLVLADEAGGEMRYRLLETLREFGEEQLTRAEQEALSRRHMAFFLALAEQAEARMHSAERYAWLERLEPELDNFRIALSWCLGSGVQEGPLQPLNTRTSGHLTTGLRLASALADFWLHSGHAGEGREWLGRLLQPAEGLGRTAERARALGVSGRLAACLYDLPGSVPLLEESTALWRELGDTVGLAPPLCILGIVKVYSGELVAARALLEECVALFREQGDRWNLAAAICNLGRLEEFEGNYERARASLEEARSLNPEVGAEETLASIIYRLGSVAEREGRLEEARELYEQSRVVTSRLPAADQSCALRELAGLARLRGEYGEARARLEECLALRKRLGHTNYLPQVLFQLAEVVLVQGDSALATSLARESLTGLNAGEHPVWTAQALRVLGRAAYERGDLREARKLLEDARSLIPTGRSFHLDADFAELLAAQGEREQAQELLTTMVARLRDSGRPVALSHVRRIQGWDELRHGECREAMTSYRESLSLLQEQGVREGAPECLEELAGTLAARFGGAALAVDGQRAAQADKDDRSLEGCGRTAGARLAARLLGAAEALREAMGAPLPAVYQPDHERTIVCLRAALDEGEVAAAWAEGRAVSLSQAVAEALAAT